MLRTKINITEVFISEQEMQQIICDYLKDKLKLTTETMRVDPATNMAKDEYNFKGLDVIITDRGPDEKI